MGAQGDAFAGKTRGQGAGIAATVFQPVGDQHDVRRLGLWRDLGASLLQRIGQRCHALRVQRAQPLRQIRAVVALHG